MLCCMATIERLRVIFVSERSTLRSVLAHACLEHLAPREFSVQSCGRPGHIGRELHVAAIGALTSARMDLPASAAPRSWEQLREKGAASARFVITLDAEVGAFQPPWPGQPDTAVWPLPDVAGLKDPERTHLARFRSCTSSSAVWNFS